MIMYDNVIIIAIEVFDIHLADCRMPRCATTGQDILNLQWQISQDIYAKSAFRRGF